jgi:predicted RNA-binding protein YlxR (DUF448 family)
MTINQRCCISCRRLAGKSEFWRVVRLNNREISINHGMGRSAYICQTEKCLYSAEKKDRLSRALKTAVPKDLYQTLKKMLATDQSEISASVCKEH